MSGMCWTSLWRCMESVYVVLEILSVLSEVCCVRHVLDFSPACVESVYVVLEILSVFLRSVVSGMCWTSLRRCVESVYVVLEILSVLSEVCCVRHVLDFSGGVWRVFMLCWRY